MTKLIINLLDALTEALGDTVHVPAEIDVSDLVTFNGSQEYKVDIYEFLHDNRMIGHLWGVTDVQSVRPDLNGDQAWQVLQHLDEQYDSGLGVSWNDLKRVAEQLYGAATTRRAARCESAIANYGKDLPESNLIDFLTDAMHWCQSNGLSFDGKLELARDHFSAESSGE